MESHGPSCPPASRCTACFGFSVSREEALPCAICEGFGRVEIDGEAAKCGNPACTSGYVDALSCRRCTGNGCHRCGDTGLEAIRLEIEAPALACEEGRPDCCQNHQRLYAGVGQ